ncbi:MAG: DUF3179 domain-containing protein [Mariprofundus sp.]|nr:DUF3179 domain-containing protein [Mariprofundus sp.]
MYSMSSRFVLSNCFVLMLWLALSGFMLSPSLIPRDQILAGGPPKDGIPALNHPKMESSDAADRWLADSDLVLGVVADGQARAYPIRILNWHEIVNDKIGNHAFVVTYCPLCGSGMVFDIADQFGVSGLLYQSDVLLYDRKTESLWSQLMMQAVTGSRAGEKLTSMPIHHGSWQAWKAVHPQTMVLSRETTYRRDYSRNPYVGYEDSSATYFPINHHDSRLHAKTWVLALSMAGRHKAWPINRLIQQGSHRERWGDIELMFEIHGDSIQVKDTSSAQLLPATRLYWFAWSTFHPDTELAKD